MSLVTASSNAGLQLAITIVLVFGLVATDGGLNATNGVKFENGLSGVNGMPLLNGLSGANGLSATNGMSLVNGLTTGFLLPEGLDLPEGNVTGFELFNFILRPEFFSSEMLGDENWNYASAVGSSGVEGLTFDNRHIHGLLKEMICLDAQVRDYFQVLVDFAWPASTKLEVCCDIPAGINASSTCEDPDHVFTSAPGKDDENSFPSAILAPHFLTSQFPEEQQEILTAAIITKFNVYGKKVRMELSGEWDLGPAGVRFEPRDMPEVYSVDLGAAWGNMFLDCRGKDADTVMCDASMEEDRFIGRHPLYRGIPMFTCYGDQDNDAFPVQQMGKSCFSDDMETANEDGCGFVANVGACNEVCVAGFCGANQPPVEHRGTKNVIYVYLEDQESTQNEAKTPGPYAIAGLCIAGVIALAMLFLVVLKYYRHFKNPVQEAVENETADKGSETTSEEENSSINP